MINLRYHIVSITAVFLALGIGLTLGSTFLDRVTVDTLKHQLDTVEAQVGETRSENERLRDRLDALDQRDDALAEELSDRLLQGRLASVPVLIVAARGTDEALAEALTAALTTAGAEVAGTWWMTERWALEDPDAVAELAALLDLRTDDEGRLRRNAAIRLAEMLRVASQVPAPADPAPEPGVDPAPAPAPAPSEPALIAGLEAAGFIEYQTPAATGGGPTMLPGAAARYVVLSGAPVDSGQQAIVTALLDEIVDDGVAAVVAAQGEVDLRDANGTPASEALRRTTFVGPLRDELRTRDRLSTVDHLDTAAGVAAVVLALEDLGVARTGHYGVAPGAARLLPGADPAT